MPFKIRKRLSFNEVPQNEVIFVSFHRNETLSVFFINLHISEAVFVKS